MVTNNEHLHILWDKNLEKKEADVNKELKRKGVPPC